MQAVLTDKIGAQAGKIALRKLGKTMKKDGCDDAIKNAVPEKLEAFVIRRPEAAMSQRGTQQPLVGKGVADLPRDRLRCRYFVIQRSSPRNRSPG